jgi:MATE family multidrug resistance protein
VDAHSILLTFCVFIYMSFPFGVSTAATIRVGNLVGANRPSEAKLAGKRTADTAFFTYTIVCSMIYCVASDDYKV